MKVTVLEAMDRLLQRVATEDVSNFYTRIHTEEGINIVTSVVANSFQGEKTVERVVCQDGQEFDADLVIIGIGVVPATELAESEVSIDKRREEVFLVALVVILQIRL